VKRTIKVGVLNYGIGNVSSVVSALEFLRGIQVVKVSNAENLEEVDQLILTGVGNFEQCFSTLSSSQLFSPLKNLVISQTKPVLGICLGMQMLCESSAEGNGKGLGLIKGNVERLSDEFEKVPSIGWKEVASSHPVFNGLVGKPFYFMHSFHAQIKDPSQIIATSDHGGKPIVAAMAHGKVLGVQFHPEKSQGDGVRFFSNFIQWANENH